MRIGIGAVRLSDIANGVLAAGTVPMARFTRGLIFDESGVPVVLAAIGTEIVALPALTLVAGDYVLISGQARATKGPAAGLISLYTEQSGGAGTILAAGSAASNMSSDPTLAAMAAVQLAVSTMWLCTVGGTVIVRLGGASSAGDAQVNAGDGQLLAWAMVGPSS